MKTALYRIPSEGLTNWDKRLDRKPLVIRGARQVGKSHLVRHWTHNQGYPLIECNFEKNPELAQLFQIKEPAKILTALELRANQKIDPKKTLLFLDEIQETPEILSVLRYFRDELPELRVISAGSLLDFALSDLKFSMPVGRIEYFFLAPLSFEEFLIASKEETLLQWVRTFSITNLLNENHINENRESWMIAHTRLLQLLKSYLIVGGMPESVNSFINSNNLLDSDRVKVSLLLTFQDDFRKYRNRVPYNRLLNLFQKAPSLIGNRFKYSQIDPEEQSRELAKALELLCMARVMYKVCNTRANGIPLHAEVNSSLFKILFLDVGLMVKSTGLNLSQIYESSDLLLVHRGAVAEQFVGQQLLTLSHFYEEPELYYWGREKQGSQAEVDYVIQIKGNMIPIEVKAGSSGKLKSLHLFLKEKNLNFGVRINSGPPSFNSHHTTLPSGDSFQYWLLSIPFYLINQLPRLVEEFYDFPKNKKIIK